MSQTERTILSGLLLNSEYSKKVIPFVAEEYFQRMLHKLIHKRDIFFGWLRLGQAWVTQLGFN